MFGAIYLDGPKSPAPPVRPMLNRALAADAEVLRPDSRTALQKVTQARGWDLKVPTTNCHLEP